MNGTGAGNDFLGWLNLPVDYDRDEFARIKRAAKKIQQICDVLIVIGIGGSYLGATGSHRVRKRSVLQTRSARRAFRRCTLPATTFRRPT